MGCGTWCSSGGGVPEIEIEIVGAYLAGRRRKRLFVAVVGLVVVQYMRDRDVVEFLVVTAEGVNIVVESG